MAIPWNLLMYVLLILLIYRSFQKEINMLLQFGMRPTKKYHLRARDIWQNQFKKRAKMAKLFQRQHKIRRLKTTGDKYTPGIEFKHIYGVLTDTRMYEFFVKKSWFSWAPIWVLIPPEKVTGGLNSREIVVKATNFKPMGFQYVPVLTYDDLGEEEEIYSRIEDYQHNILSKEQIGLTEEMKVHAAITGAEVSEISEDLVSRQVMHPEAGEPFAGGDVAE